MQRFRICVNEFRAILVRLDSGSVIVPIPGRDEKATLDRGRFAEWVRARLYRPSSASILPWAIHRAYLGDWSPVVEGILSAARERDSAASFGLFFSITCNDDIAFLREEDVAPETQGDIPRRLPRAPATGRLPGLAEGLGAARRPHARAFIGADTVRLRRQRSGDAALVHDASGGRLFKSERRSWSAGTVTQSGAIASAGTTSGWCEAVPWRASRIRAKPCRARRSRRRFRLNSMIQLMAITPFPPSLRAAECRRRCRQPAALHI